MQPVQDKESKRSPGIKLITFTLNLGIAPLRLLSRLIDDEVQLRRLNNEIQNEGLRHGTSRTRMIVLPAAAFFPLLQLGLAYCVLAGVGTTGYGGPSAAVVNLFTKMKIPSYSELFSLWTMSGFILATLVPYIFYFQLFKAYRSKYQQCIRALESEMGGSLAAEGKKYWFYPERLLCLYNLRGVIGDDILKRTAMWNSANFTPTPDIIKIENENSYIFIGGVRKASSSTMFYDRYDEWTILMQDNRRKLQWFLGEYVNRTDYAFRKADVDFSIAFLGQSGSGKTETMKMWLLAWLCKHPTSKIVIGDLKGSGDWDVFAPMVEFGKILKSSKEVLMALMYVDDLMEGRRQYMAEKSYSGFLIWASTEKVDVPPIIIIIDEFPQIKGDLRYDMQYTKAGTPANAIYRLMTMGRSYGLWMNIGSQFATSDIIPSEMNKNIKIRYVLKLGNPSESSYWLESTCAADLGKTRRLPNGSIDAERGYGFIGAAAEFVRSWYTPDFYIEHELRKYEVHVLEGQKYPLRRDPQLPLDIQMQIDAMAEEGKGVEALEPYYQKLISNHNLALAKFKFTMEKLRKKEKDTPPVSKKPAGLLWLQDEPLEQYVGRTGALRKLPRTAQQNAINHYNRQVAAGGPLSDYVVLEADYIEAGSQPPPSAPAPPSVSAASPRPAPVPNGAPRVKPAAPPAADEDDDLDAFLKAFREEHEKKEKAKEQDKKKTTPPVPGTKKPPAKTQPAPQSKPVTELKEREPAPKASKAKSISRKVRDKIQNAIEEAEYPVAGKPSASDFDFLDSLESKPKPPK